MSNWTSSAIRWHGEKSDREGNQNSGLDGEKTCKWTEERDSGHHNSNPVCQQKNSSACKSCQEIWRVLFKIVTPVQKLIWLIGRLLRNK